MVAPNGQDAKLGLAQQLLAFILNVRHFVGSSASVLDINGTNVSAQALIDAALLAWETGDPDEVNAWQATLDYINNLGTVEVIHGEPCPVVYPQ